MGKFLSANGRDLAVGFNNCMAGTPLPYHDNVRPIVFCICLLASMAYRKSMAGGGLANHRPGIPAIYLLYDHRPKDHGQKRARPMHCGLFGGCSGDDPSASRSSVRPVLCSVSGRPDGFAARDVVAVAHSTCSSDHYLAQRSCHQNQSLRDGCIVTTIPQGSNLTTDWKFRKLIFITFLAVAVVGCKTKASEPAPSASQSSSMPAAEPASPPVSQTSSDAVKRPSGPVQFVDVTSQAGISFKHNSGAFGKKYLPETMGSGVCFLDYDNDGWQDILFVNSMDWPDHKTGRFYPALYHNNKDGTFTNVTRQAGLQIETYGMGCAVGDFDNDGYDDIYITSVGSNHLFRNLHNGRFEDVTSKAGVGSPGFSTSAIWFDYDNDGKLDLFVSHYVTWSEDKDQFCSLDGKNKSYCTPEAYKGESGTLFHNKGNGVFEDVTRRAGLYDPSCKSLGIAMLDYDDDGWIDLFVANDTQRNKLYHNNRDGTFTDTGEVVGVAYGESGGTRAGMGVDAGDYDHSGRQGLIIGNFTNEGLALYRNDGTGLFSQSLSAGVSEASLNVLTFGTFFFDYDLDGLLDIFAADGHVADDISVLRPTLKYEEPALLFRNRGKGKFEDVTSRMGPALRRPVVGRGAAYGDFDNDGDLDLVLTTNNGRARLLRNENGNQDDMLRIKLVGVQSNRDGIGAKLRLTSSGGLRQYAMVKSGSSYLSQSELPVTFGLGKPETGKTADLEVLWPSGKREILRQIEPNQSLVIEEGHGAVSKQPINFISPAGHTEHH